MKMSPEANMLESPKRPAWRSRASAALLVLVACAAYWWGANNANSPLPNGGLVVEEKYLTFPETWEDSKFTWQVPILNRGRVKLEILGFAVSCPCVSTKTGSLRLEAGEEQVLTLQINLAGQLACSKVERYRVFEFKVVPLLQGEIAPTKGWVIRGQVRSLLDTNPMTHQFGKYEIITNGQMPSQTVEVASAIPLERLTLGYDRTKCLATITGGPRTFQLKITPKNDLPVGPFFLELVLTPFSKEGKELGFKRFRVEGWMHQEVEAEPSTLLLGSLALGKTETENIRFVSRNGMPFSVLGWKSWSHGLSAERLPSHSKADNTFKVVQEAKHLGQQRARILFLVQTRELKTLEVPLETIYHGVE